MAGKRVDGGWPYRGFIVRYHRLADGEVRAPDALWWAAIPDAPELPPLTGPTYVAVRTAAERAIDALLAQGRPVPPARSPHYRDYRRLADYLATLPSTVRECVLSFAQLEALFGGPLPKTAQTARQYWRDETEVRVQRWVAQGWVARLAVEEQAVVFTRTARQEE